VFPTPQVVVFYDKIYIGFSVDIILDYEAVCYGWLSTTFQRNLLPSALGWKKQQYEEDAMP